MSKTKREALKVYAILEGDNEFYQYLLTARLSAVRRRFSSLYNTLKEAKIV